MLLDAGVCAITPGCASSNGLCYNCTGMSNCPVATTTTTTTTSSYEFFLVYTRELIRLSAIAAVCSTLQNQASCNVSQPRCLWITSLSQCYDCTIQNCLISVYFQGFAHLCRYDVRSSDNNGGTDWLFFSHKRHSLRSTVHMGYKHRYLSQSCLQRANNILWMLKQLLLHFCR